ncbi:MAG: hypothetical protein DMG15_08635 [Acidobacteria bacterium]|nr:MAG: hypothetical protein DMG15_08635 [Acidobacteriota bacterium]
MRLKNVGVRMFVGLMLACISTPPMHASTLANQAFSFGPGPFPFFGTNSASRTLNVPGKTLVSVLRGSLDPLPVSPGGLVAFVPVTIEVIRPEGGVVATAQTTAFALVPNSFILALPPLPPVFISDFGCPRTWRVRVRSSDGAVPLVRVSGQITFDFFVPGEFPNTLPATYNVDMEGPSIHLEGGGSSATPTLAGHDPLLLGVANRSLIQSTEGTFRIKAKWDTAFHLCYLNQIFPLNVALLKPGGNTVANGETNFSQTTTNPKLDFSYTVTPADAQLAGSWRLRITNNNVVNNFCTLGSNLPVAIDNFDVENFAFPAFQSTFTPQCSEGVGTFDITPTDSTVAVGDRLNYVFSWIVPEPLNWHDLQFLQLRIRELSDNEENDKHKNDKHENDKHKRLSTEQTLESKDSDSDEDSQEGPSDGDTILWVRFDEARNLFSLFKEGQDEFGNGFPAGSPVSLETSQATLHLADSGVVGSGPTGRSVALNLSLSFKPKTAGHEFVVEVAASNDSGVESGFEQADIVKVVRKKAK